MTSCCPTIFPANFPMPDTGDPAFAPLNDRLDDLTRNLSPDQMRGLKDKIGTSARSSNVQRIKKNVTPDGEPMVPRKAKKRGGGRQRGGRRPTKLRVLKAQRMFQGAIRPRYLRKRVTGDQVEVGYTGALARIMRVHQEGLRDHVTRADSSPEVTYPARPVLGLTPDDRLRILQLVVDQIG